MLEADNCLFVRTYMGPISVYNNIIPRRTPIPLQCSPLPRVLLTPLISPLFDTCDYMQWAVATTASSTVLC